MEAEHFGRRARGSKGGVWRIIKGLGRSGDSVSVFPKSLPRHAAGATGEAPVLHYDFYSFGKGEVTVELHCLPTKAINASYRSQVAVAVDDGKPVIIDPVRKNVLDNLAVYRCKYDLVDSGQHVLDIGMIDPQVVIDKIVIITNAANPTTYLGPRESPRFK